MWIRKNTDGSNSKKDRRTLDMNIKTPDMAGFFSNTLYPLEWCNKENMNSEPILIEFECIEELKNFNMHLDLLIKNYEELIK